MKQYLEFIYIWHLDITQNANMVVYEAGLAPHSKENKPPKTLVFR